MKSQQCQRIWERMRTEHVLQRVVTIKKTGSNHWITLERVFSLSSIEKIDYDHEKGDVSEQSSAYHADEF